MVGSGAWKFQEWRQGESITLVRNDDYYGKVPYLDSYVDPHLAGSDGHHQRAAQWRDRCAELEPADVETVEATEGLKVATSIQPAASPST